MPSSGEVRHLHDSDKAAQRETQAQHDGLKDEVLRLERAEADLALTDEALRRQIALAQTAGSRIEELEGSVYWRATYPARWVADRLPPGFRTAVRRLVTMIWLWGTLRPGKWRRQRATEKSAFLSSGGTVPAESAVAGSSVAHASGVRAPRPPDVPAPSPLRFPQREPLRVFRSPHSAPMVNVVTDTISEGSVSPGTETAAVLAALVASRRGSGLRVVTRIDRGDLATVHRFIRAHGVRFDGPMELEHAGVDGRGAVPVGDGDMFLTTSWWTTLSTVTAVGYSRVAYLLHHDEQTACSSGDERLRCRELLGDRRLRVVVTGEQLLGDLADGPDRVPGLRERAVAVDLGQDWEKALVPVVDEMMTWTCSSDAGTDVPAPG